MSKNGKKSGKADKDDARLLVQLYDSQATAGITDAVSYIWSSEFPETFEQFREKFPAGSAVEEVRNVFKVLGYYETVGTLYKHNLIDEDLLFDWLAAELVWQRLANWVTGFRAEINVPSVYENFEYMATKAAAWREKRA